jgi:hypothetical protein
MANTEDLEAGRIPDHTPVVGSDGRHLGTVDRVEGEYVKLNRSDPEAGGMHHWLPLRVVAGLEGGILRLSLPASQAREAWLNEHEVAERIALDPAAAVSFGRPVPPDDTGPPQGNRAQGQSGPKGEREPGQGGPQPGPGETSFGVNRPV